MHAVSVIKDVGKSESGAKPCNCFVTSPGLPILAQVATTFLCTGRGLVHSAASSSFKVAVCTAPPGFTVCASFSFSGKRAGGCEKTGGGLVWLNGGAAVSKDLRQHVQVTNAFQPPGWSEAGWQSNQIILCVLALAACRRADCQWAGQGLVGCPSTERLWVFMRFHGTRVLTSNNVGSGD